MASFVTFGILWFVSRRWDGLYGHINDLGSYVAWGCICSLVGLSAGWFGIGWRRIVALVMSALLFMFWLWQSKAV
jgi:hypothetical protein